MGENRIIELIAIALILLWLVNNIGSEFTPSLPKGNNLIHGLLVIAIILIVLKQL